MFGQIPDFTNSFDFMRRLWGGGAGMPGGLMPGLQAMTPPMDLDDIDKRIADLKAVESWLQLNTNLLRTTIQGLEVQKAALDAMRGGDKEPQAASTAPADNPMLWPWQMMQSLAPDSAAAAEAMKAAAAKAQKPKK